MGLSQIVSMLNISAGSENNYYYNCLNDEQKKIYLSLQSCIRSCAKSVKLPMRPAHELNLIYRAVLADNAMFFYANGFQYQTDTYKQRIIVEPSYEYSRADISAYTNAVHEHLRVYDNIRNRSDSEKEKFVHDYCSEHFSYGDMGNESHSVLGLVLNKTAVCEGIANYVKVTLDYLDIRSLVVSGKAQSPLYYDKMENHAWNIVMVDGQTYHLDVTFDMTIKNKITRYDYFNLCDDAIRKDHIIVSDTPKCIEASKEYYMVNKMAVQGKSGLENYLTRRIKNGERTILVKLLDVTRVNNIADKVMQVAGQAYMKARDSGVSIEVSCNQSQMVFEINYK